MFGEHIMYETPYWLILHSRHTSFTIELRCGVYLNWVHAPSNCRWGVSRHGIPWIICSPNITHNLCSYWNVIFMSIFWPGVNHLMCLRKIVDKIFIVIHLRWVEAHWQMSWLGAGQSIQCYWGIQMSCSLGPWHCQPGALVGEPARFKAVPSHNFPSVRGHQNSIII